MSVSQMTHKIDKFQLLLSKIGGQSAQIAIIGMGYVGLPLALAATKSGFRVIGFDIDVPKIDRLNVNISPLQHIGNEAIATMRNAGRFEATADFQRLKDSDAIIICVPTPLTRYREPDLSAVVNTSKAIAATLREGQLVVLESTSFPGTTNEIVRPILEATGLKSGRDFLLAFSPEREDPGNQHYSTSKIPKVVGADSPIASEAACALYSAFIEQVVPVSSAATAEAVKITENIFRAVNIALINELKIIYTKMGIDIFEVVNAAKTKPFGFMPFYPGPGLGGHCIPIDPFYLTWKAREVGIRTRFIELAGEINSNMPVYVISKLSDALDQRKGISLSRAKILIVGVAYKKNIDDIRESPALAIMDILCNRGATIDYFDPHVPEIPKTRAHSQFAGWRSVPWDESMFGRYDAVLILTDHDGIDWQMLVERASLIIDTRNVTKNGRRSEKIIIA